MKWRVIGVLILGGLSVITPTIFYVRGDWPMLLLTVTLWIVGAGFIIFSEGGRR